MNAGLKGSLDTIHEFLLTRGWKLVTAESITCDLIASTLAEVSGCSAWHRGGFAVYNIEMKVDVLGVDWDVAAACNCVSAIVANQMADGAARLTRCDVVIATTGYAEAWPEGGVETPYAHVHIKMGLQSWDFRIEPEGVMDRNEMRNWVACQAIHFLAGQMA